MVRQHVQRHVVRAEFQKLDLLNTPSSLSVSEDGRTIVIGHELEDLLAVVDTASGKVVRTVETSRPVSILCRGDKVLVANNGQGTISVFTPAQDWEKTDEVEVGFENIKTISAPQGKYFTNWVLATCKEHDSVARLNMVNVATDKHHTVGNAKVGGGAATASYDGRFYVVQAEVWSGAGVNEVRDFKAATTGRESDSPPFGPDHAGFIYQGRSRAPIGSAALS